MVFLFPMHFCELNYTLSNWGFRKVLARKLHNHIYKEQCSRPHEATGSPWSNKPYTPTLGTRMTDCTTS